MANQGFDQANPLWSHSTVDVANAEAVLRETKSVLDERGVTFFLRQGTCLGAVRDRVIMPWDDDIDLGSIIGMHGLTEQKIQPAADAFRDRGFDVTMMTFGDDVYVGMMKLAIRVDWFCYRAKGDFIHHYPGLKIPIRFFVDLAEIDFLGERYLVPNPPEEYLSVKYGPDWMTPKPVGYELDVLASLPDPDDAPWHKRLGRWVAAHRSQRRRARFVVRGAEGEPLVDATVTIAGVSRGYTDAAGCVTLYLPATSVYAVVVAYNGADEVLYEELLTAGHRHVCTADPQRSVGRTYVLVDGS